MYKKYIVRLTQQERSQLETLVRSGRAHARKLLYGRIVLKADSGRTIHASSCAVSTHQRKSDRGLGRPL